jgi:hypothetical protein
MANGFDSILADARKNIQVKQQQEAQRHQKEKLIQVATPEPDPSPEEVEQAKEHIRAILGRSLFRTAPMPEKRQSEEERRAFLLAQARQLEKFGRL